VGWHRYALGPNLSVLRPEERFALARSVDEEPIGTDEADALFQIVRGFGNVTAFRRDPGAAAVESLLKKGLIRQERGYYVLSPDVAFSVRPEE
jgi:hypothetical protein